MPQSDDELPSLDALQTKIDHIKSASAEDDTQEKDGQKYGKAMNLATEFFAGIGVGSVIGYGLDYALGTLPIFFIVFFLLGFAAALRNMMRQYEKVD